jgi:GntR family transcriptional repressor for pyruvate dehydrogenase complex
MGNARLQPIAHSPLYEQVAQRLQEFIAGAKLQPGDRLMTERELAEQLGVSRTSVRQALTALRVRGMIEIRHGDGVYLQRPPGDLVSTFASEIAGAEIDHPMIWEVREAIEVQAARLAARRRNEGDLSSMRDALAAMARSIAGGGDGIDGDRLFHGAVVDAAHNPLLKRLVLELADVIDRTSESSLTLPGRAPQSLKAHQLILQAIEERNEPRAAETMRQHIMASAELVTARSSQR